MNKVFETFHKPCKLCGTLNNLTRHHVKNDNGKKNGKIEILCRSCHNEVEEYYRLVGIVSHNVKMSKQEKLERDYDGGLLPFYSLGKKT